MNLNKAIMEFREQLRGYERTQRSILNKALIDNRELTAAERKDFERLEAKMSAAQTELDRLEERVRQADGARHRAEMGTGGAADEPGSTEGFQSFGDYLRAVAFSARPGGDRDERLVAMAAGASSAVPSDGGFAVPEQFAREIMRRVNDVGAVAARCRRLPLSTGTAKLPYVDETSRATGSRFGGVRVYRANEGATVTATKPKLDRLELTLEKLMGIGYATDELLEDAPLMGELMAQAFAEELAFTVDDEIVRGDGAGKCLGILNSPCRVTVPKESGQAAGTVTFENILKMWSRCWGRSRRNAVWLVNQDVEPQLFSLSQVIGTGGAPVFLPSGGLSAEPYSTLFGRPIIPVEVASTLGTEGDIMLCDLSQFLLYERSGGARFDSSMHVRFLYDEMTFRVTWRVSGQPAWKTAVTPANGSNTLSPFVTLQTRA